FKTECVLSDSRYAGLKNLKTIRDCGQARMTRLKPNRLINPDSTGAIPCHRLIFQKPELRFISKATGLSKYSELSTETAVPNTRPLMTFIWMNSGASGFPISNRQLRNTIAD
ncbi:hypothetical protein QUF90_01635, partial [Desulfococcaceae bacterium HSG9]|nr:hypothetical protein [Desulfococcaceae bacterium HSG9]